MLVRPGLGLAAFLMELTGIVCTAATGSVSEQYSLASCSPAYTAAALTKHLSIVRASVLRRDHAGESERLAQRVL